MCCIRPLALFGKQGCRTTALESCELFADGDKAQVGICHNVFWTEPMRGGPFYAHVR